jgi:aquaporin Z
VDAWASEDRWIEARRLLAETWGTFLLALVAAGAAIGARLDPAHVSASAAAAAPGLMVMAVIYFEGDVSGAHLNPAVTLAFAARGNFPWARTPGYFAAQVAGALGAALFLQAIFGSNCALGVTRPGPGLSDLKALAVEIVLTAALVSTILGTASNGRNVGPNAAIAVGAYIALAGLWAAPLSGASMNPARSLGPALVCGGAGSLWIYLVGPVLGAMVGVALEWALKGPPTREGTKAAQGG